MSYTLFQPYFIRNSVLFYHPVERCYYVEYLGEENELDIYGRYVFRNPFLPLSREEDIWRGKIVDITDIPDVTQGEMAHILDDFYTADDMGRDCGTIGYEILSRIGKSPRRLWREASAGIKPRSKR